MTRNHFQQSQAATHNTLGHFRTYSGLPRCPYVPARKLDFAIFKLFWYRFFPHHAQMAWNDQEQLPGVLGSHTQHSGSLLNIFRVAAGPVCAYGKALFCDFQAILILFLPLSCPNGLVWPGTTSSSPRQPNTTLWVNFQYFQGCRSARTHLQESAIFKVFWYCFLPYHALFFTYQRGLLDVKNEFLYWKTFSKRWIKSTGV